MSQLDDLLTGIGTLLASTGQGFVYNATTVFAPADIAIVKKSLPTAPDRCLVLNAVSMGDNITMPLGKVMVQLRGRGAQGAPMDVDTILDSAFAYLHGLKAITCGSVNIVQMYRTTTVPNGQDELKRFERIDQYYVDLDYPPTSLRPTGGSW